MKDIPIHWNPHMKLEFMKCMIRSIYVEDVQKINKRKIFERELLRREVEFLNTKLEFEKNDALRETISTKLD